MRVSTWTKVTSLGIIASGTLLAWGCGGSSAGMPGPQGHNVTTQNQPTPPSSLPPSARPTVSPSPRGSHSSAPSPSPRPTASPTSDPTSSPTATPRSSPTPAPTIATQHVLTADYDNGPAPSQVAPYVTWLSTSWQNNPAVRAAGIKAMYYTNPNRVLPSQNIWPYISGNENNFAHDCSGNRIQSLAYGGEYITDPGVNVLSTVKDAYLQFIQSRTDGNHQWDAIYEDEANDLEAVTTMPCGYDAASWAAASVAETSYQVGYNIIFNGLGLGASEFVMDDAPNAIGGLFEGCYSASNQHPEIWPPFWTNAANAQIYQAQRGRLFFCMTQDYTPADAAATSRIYSYASFMLTYSANSSVYWALHPTPSGSDVLPESELIPTSPLNSTPNDISGLQISGGVYGREYANCYVKGRAVGPCAAVVNSDRYNSFSYPYGSKYKHTLVLFGSGLLDGGSLSTSGGAPPSTMGPLTAVVVFQ